LSRDAKILALFSATLDHMSERPASSRAARVHARRARRELWLALRLGLRGLPGLSGRSLLWAPWLIATFIARRLFEALLAIVLIFEEWGWKPLARAMAWLGEFKLVARAERAVAALPPYGALAAFLGPSLVLFPLKLLALYLIATGHALMAGLLFIGAKLVGTAVLARLYMLTLPKLMQIGWFARAHDRLIPWKDALFARIRASWAWRYGRIVKHRAVLRMQKLALVWRPAIQAQMRIWRSLAQTMATRVRAWIVGGNAKF
jgi:hypothetical protein